MKTEIVSSGKLSVRDLAQINTFRSEEFGIASSSDLSCYNEGKTSLFFLLKDDGGKLLAFALLEDLLLRFQKELPSVLCVSTVIATQKGKKFGVHILSEVQKFAKEKGKTLLGFCETDMIPYYRKCGFTILSNEDNQFMYCDEKGNHIPNIVPGEVFYLDGNDRIMETILSSSDKRVFVLRN